MLERIIDFGNAMQCFSKITFDSFCSDVILVSDFYYFLKNDIALFFQFTKGSFTNYVTQMGWLGGQQECYYCIG